MSEDEDRAMIRITGRVQGVAFRAWTRDQAERLDLTGWVKNEPDGSVTALIVGPAAAVATMLELLRKGPPAASVSGVERLPAGTGDRPQDFRINR